MTVMFSFSSQVKWAKKPPVRQMKPDRRHFLSKILKSSPMLAVLAVAEPEHGKLHVGDLRHEEDDAREE